MDGGPHLAFGPLLRRRRIAAGMTQEELAERAGISRRSIGDLERGVAHRPHRDTVTLLAEALALPTDERSAFADAARRLGVRAGAAPIPTTASSPPLVGRARELALLERHLAGEGPPVVLLAGEPGIGKTRLLRAAIPRAAALGLRVLEGGCQRRGGQAPFAPLLGALQRHIRGQRPTALRTELQGCAWLVRLLPELADGPIPPLPAWTLSPEQEHRLMVEAVVQFLRNVAGPSGTLLVLDDLQWAGADALDLLVTLARAAAEIPLRLVGAYRDTEVRPEDPLSVALADLAHAGLASRRLLGPLAPDEAAHLLAGLLGIDAAAEGWVALRERVLRQAGGVPFFVVSCAQALGREDREDVGEGSMPWSIAQSVRQRVAALPEAACEVLGVAAVAGRVVESGLLAAVAARPEEAVLLGLEAACRARLLEEWGGAAYQFAHDVIREVVEADLGAARRRLLHRRIAEALERRPGERPVELLAYHYGRSDAHEKAILYLEQAGDNAQGQYAHATAEAAYRELLARLDGPDRVAHEAQVREKLGRTLEMAARYDAALDVLEQAATTYERVGDLEGLRRALAQIGRVHASRGTPEAGLARLQGHLEQLTSGAPSLGAAALYAAVAWLNVVCNQYRDSLEAAERAAQLARTAGAERILADVEVRRAVALQAIGRLDEGRRVAEGAIPLVEAVGDLSALGRIFNILGIIAKLQGEFDRSRQHHERALALTERIGEVIGRRWAMASLGELLFLRGEWDAAPAQLERAAELTHSHGWSHMANLPLICLAEFHLARGEREAATRYAEESIERSRALGRGDWRLNGHKTEQAVLAEQDLLAGQAARACARLLPLLDGVDFEVVELLPLLAWARLETGDVAAASELVTRAIAGARAQQNLLALVDALRVRAMVATRQGRREAARAALAEGLALARTMPYPYAEARLLQVEGRLHVEKGDTAQARERLEAAQAIFRRLGARAGIEGTGHLLAALG